MGNLGFGTFFREIEIPGLSIQSACVLARFSELEHFRAVRYNDLYRDQH